MSRTNKHTSKETETYKHRTRQDKSMLNKRNKETEAKMVELGSLSTSIRGHTWACVRGTVLCIHILRVYVCIQKACIRIHALKP